MLPKLERHICNWKREGTDKINVGELILNGNRIEFYVKDTGNASPAIYIGEDLGHFYKVVTNSTVQFGTNKTIDLAASYNARYVLIQNYSFNPGRETSGITGFSFVIPELMDWFHGIVTVKMLADSETDELYAQEISLPEIVLKSDSPRISVSFESSSANETMKIDSRTQAIIKNEPRIFVNYDSTVDTEQVRKDIRHIMQFWGLMIGTVSDALDIRLNIEGAKLKSWLYLNTDFSYNTFSKSVFSRPLTTIETVGEKIQDYFTSWYDFCCNEKFNLVRNMYFSYNNRKTVFAEDIFVTYVRVLEGYHLRMTGDEEKANAIKEAISAFSGKIKELIFTDEGKKTFSEALSVSEANWNFTSKHADAIATWIASGFLERKGLSERLKELDKQFYNVISMNSSIITDRLGEKQDAKTENLYFRMIVATRNYYSHFKNDPTNVFQYQQLNDSIYVLKSLIVMILFSQMGMINDDIRKIVCFDSELSHRTMFLRQEGEKPPVS